VAILGESEIQQGKVALKNMKTGEQVLLGVEQLIKKLRS
jgi:histidyl-tRNA synthetase